MKKNIQTKKFLGVVPFRLSNFRCTFGRSQMRQKEKKIKGSFFILRVGYKSLISLRFFYFIENVKLRSYPHEALA